MARSFMEVRALQSLLEDRGFDPGPIDGIVGRKTIAALDTYLRSNGLQFDIREAGGRLVLTGPLPHDTGRDTQEPVHPVAPQSDHPLPWMAVAYDMLGLHEVRDNAKLKAFLRSDRATVGDPARIPWCGDFVETCIKRGLPEEIFTGRVRENPYLARNWLDFGDPCDPTPGAVMVFWRGSRSGTSGHVAFYVGEDDYSYYVLGGNQSNKVSITRIAKHRLLGARWPNVARQMGYHPGGPKIINDPDIVLSVNEA